MPRVPHLFVKGIIGDYKDDKTDQTSDETIAPASKATENRN
jgi:hypothetical protein